jgi:hypothetical protein
MVHPRQQPGRLERWRLEHGLLRGPGAPSQGFPVSNADTVLATPPVSREKPVGIAGSHVNHAADPSGYSWTASREATPVMLPPPGDFRMTGTQDRDCSWNYGAIRFADAVPVNTTTVGVVAGGTG